MDKPTDKVETKAYIKTKKKVEKVKRSYLMQPDTKIFNRQKRSVYKLGSDILVHKQLFSDKKLPDRTTYLIKSNPKNKKKFLRWNKLPSEIGNEKQKKQAIVRTATALEI